MFFTPKYLKEAKLLQKGIQKFIHYKRDVLSTEKMEEIDASFDEFKQAVKAKDKVNIKMTSRKIRRLCEGALPAPENAVIRENVEVFFVAIVIALGIRTYIAQPFRIPTGSMRPTLNGIVAYSGAEADERGVSLNPNILVKVKDFLWRGRRYVDVKAPEDMRIAAIYQKNRLLFFTRTIIQTDNGKTISIPATLSEALSHLGLQQFISGANQWQNRSEIKRSALRQNVIPKGTQLARGYVETGDQVIVNRVSYHFRKPDRGEVFVFGTRDIKGIFDGMVRDHGKRIAEQMGSQHYIKRLTGVPGDMLNVENDGYLYLRQDPNGNWTQSPEPGCLKVATNEDPKFRGYTNDDARMSFPTHKPLSTNFFYKRKHENFQRGREFFAMGDNSRSSLDSRYVGPIPEKNLIGPAFFVYFPFDKHFGRIR